MELYYITKNGVGSIDADFIKTYLSDKEVKSLEELTEDDRYLFLNDDQRDFYIKYMDEVVDDPMAVYYMKTPVKSSQNERIRKIRENTYISKSDPLYMAYIKYKEFGEDEAAAKAYNEWKQAVLEIEEANPYITE